MNDPFWDHLLEEGETLQWTGRPRPALHWRNLKLVWPFAVAALGALWMISNPNATGIVLWDALALFGIGVVTAFMVLRGMERLNILRQTRYALTNRRILFFRVGKRTRVRAFERTLLRPPVLIPTAPRGLLFLAPGGDSATLGFEYVQSHAILHREITRLIEEEPIP